MSASSTRIFQMQNSIYSRILYIYICIYIYVYIYMYIYIACLFYSFGPKKYNGETLHWYHSMSIFTYFCASTHGYSIDGNTIHFNIHSIYTSSKKMEIQTTCCLLLNMRPLPPAPLAFLAAANRAGLMGTLDPSTQALGMKGVTSRARP